MSKNQEATPLPEAMDQHTPRNKDIEAQEKQPAVKSAIGGASKEDEVSDQVLFRRMVIYIFEQYNTESLGGLLKFSQDTNDIKKQGASVTFDLERIPDILKVNSVGAEVLLKRVLGYRVNPDDVEFLKSFSLLHRSKLIILERIVKDKKKNPLLNLDHRIRGCNKAIDNCKANMHSSAKVKKIINDLKSPDIEPIKIDNGSFWECDMGFVVRGDSFLHVAIRSGFPLIPHRHLNLAAAILGLGSQYNINIYDYNELKHNAIHELTLARVDPLPLLYALLRENLQEGFKESLGKRIRISLGEEADAPGNEEVLPIQFSQDVCKCYCEKEMPSGFEPDAQPYGYSDAHSKYADENINGVHRKSQYAYACRKVNYLGVHPYYMSHLSCSRDMTEPSLYMPKEKAHFKDNRATSNWDNAEIERICLPPNRKLALDVRFTRPGITEISQQAEIEAGQSRRTLWAFASWLAAIGNVVFSVVSEMEHCSGVNESLVNCSSIDYNVDLCEASNNSLVCFLSNSSDVCEDTASIAFRSAAGGFFLAGLVFGIHSFLKEFESWRYSVHHSYTGNKHFEKWVTTKDHDDGLQTKTPTCFHPNVSWYTILLIVSSIVAVCLEASGLGIDDPLWRSGLTSSASLLFSTAEGISTSGVSDNAQYVKGVIGY